MVVKLVEPNRIATALSMGQNRVTLKLGSAIDFAAITRINKRRSKSFPDTRIETLFEACLKIFGPYSGGI